MMRHRPAIWVALSAMLVSTAAAAQEASEAPKPRPKSTMFGANVRVLFTHYNGPPAVEFDLDPSLWYSIIGGYDFSDFFSVKLSLSFDPEDIKENIQFAASFLTSWFDVNVTYGGWDGKMALYSGQDEARRLVDEADVDTDYFAIDLMFSRLWGVRYAQYGIPTLIKTGHYGGEGTNSDFQQVALTASRSSIDPSFGIKSGQLIVAGDTMKEYISGNPRRIDGTPYEIKDGLGVGGRFHITAGVGVGKVSDEGVVNIGERTDGRALPDRDAMVVVSDFGGAAMVVYNLNGGWYRMSFGVGYEAALFLQVIAAGAPESDDLRTQPQNAFVDGGVATYLNHGPSIQIAGAF